MDKKPGMVSMSSPITQLLHRTASLTGFPVTNPSFPRPLFPNNGRMLMVFNHMLQNAQSPVIQSMQSDANLPNVTEFIQSAHSQSCPDMTNNCDDDFTSFEDQMKELMDREKKVQGFHSEWRGNSSGTSNNGFLRFDKITDYTRDNLQVDLNQLVTDLVEERVIETDVPSGSRAGGEESDYLLKILSPHPPLSDEPPECSSSDGDDQVCGNELNESFSDKNEDYYEQASGMSWYGRNVNEMFAMMTVDDSPADLATMSKAEKDKEKLDMFQTLKISALRKGYH